MDTQGTRDEDRAENINSFHSPHTTLNFFSFCMSILAQEYKIHVKDQGFKKKVKPSLAMRAWLGVNSLLLSSP